MTVMETLTRWWDEFSWSRLVYVSIVIIGATGSWILASELNTRRYHLILEDDRAWVGRGLRMPLGRQPFEPELDELAPAYVPLPLPQGLAVAREERLFPNRVALDHALFDLYLRVARYGLEAGEGEPRDLAATGEALARLDHLPGLSIVERKLTSSLRRRRDYHRARALLARSARQLKAAEGWLAAASEPPGMISDARELAERARRAAAALTGIVEEAPGDVLASSDGVRAATEASTSTATAPEQGLGIVDSSTASNGSTQTSTAP